MQPGRGRGHEDPSGCLRKTRDRAQQKVDSSAFASILTNDLPCEVRALEWTFIKITAVSRAPAKSDTRDGLPGKNHEDS